MEGEGQIELIQKLLDAGFSRNRVASALRIHHKSVGRLVEKYALELYVPFDENQVSNNYGCADDLLTSEDLLEEFCNEAFDTYKSNLNSTLGEHYYMVGRYVRDNYGNLENYLESKGKKVLSAFMSKNCNTCSNSRSLSHYSNKRNSLFGINTQCNFCQSARVMRYYLENEEYRKRANEAAKRWALKNREKMKNHYHKRLARKKYLPDDLTYEQLVFINSYFNYSCALTLHKGYHLDHVIPLSIGHGGTTYGNMIPLRSDLNLSKNNSNIFEWFEANRQRFELSQERFDNLIAWLASANAMSVEEYRDYVYWCHANPRSIDELKDAAVADSDFPSKEVI